MARHHKGDPLDVAVWMHRPLGAGDECVVVEDAQRPDAHVVGIAVAIEREMPPRLEPAAVDRIDRPRGTDTHRSRHAWRVPPTPRTPPQDGHSWKRRPS